MFPTCTAPKLRLAGFEVRVPGAAPVPDRGMVKVGFDAVEVTVRVALAAPADAGSNETLKLALWPPARVRGAVIPLIVNPDPPAIATFEIEMLALPTFEIVSDRVCFVPTGTTPKLRLAGLDEIALAAMPVPVSAMVRVGSGASERMVTVPPTLPVVTGAKETVNDVLCEGFKVRGALIPLN